MEHLFSRRAPNLPPAGLAEVFDRLLWCLDASDGAEILETQRDWLRSGDLEKIEIALAMSEVFPYSTREELAENLDRLVKQFPSLVPARDKMLDAWDKTMANAIRRWRLRRR